MLRILCLMVLLIGSASSQIKALWTEQIPLFPLEGEKVKYRVRMGVAVNRVSFVAFGSTTEIPLASVGDRLWEIEMTTPRFEPRDVYSKFMGFIRAFDGQNAFTVVNVGLHGHSSDLPAVRGAVVGENGTHQGTHSSQSTWSLSIDVDQRRKQVPLHERPLVDAPYIGKH